MAHERFPGLAADVVAGCLGVATTLVEEFIDGAR